MPQFIFVGLGLVFAQLSVFSSVFAHFVMSGLHFFQAGFLLRRQNCLKLFHVFLAQFVCFAAQFVHLLHQRFNLLAAILTDFVGLGNLFFRQS